MFARVRASPSEEYSQVRMKTFPLPRFYLYEGDVVRVVLGVEIFHMSKFSAKWTSEVRIYFSPMKKDENNGS